VAADRLAKLKKAGVDKIGFAWAGETERGKKHYYRVQGRRSSWSTTTRRTTAITCIQCGAISMGTLAGTC
jgi:hypothetical protein